jgi:hypothetical protein
VSKQGYNGNYRERYKLEVESGIRKDQTIKMQKEAIQEQAEMIHELSDRCLNLSYDLKDLKAQARREGSYKAACIFMAVVTIVLILKEVIG